MRPVFTPYQTLVVSSAMVFAAILTYPLNTWWASGPITVVSLLGVQSWMVRWSLDRSERRRNQIN